jgi:hypothetical protein
LSIDEFRKHKYLPSQWAKELATSGILQAVIALMEENHPARFAIRGDGNEDVSPTRAAIELGLTRGYSKYGDTLKLLAKPILSMQNVGESSYEEPPVPRNPLQMK